MSTETEGQINKTVSYSIDLDSKNGDPFSAVTVTQPPVVTQAPEPPKPVDPVEPVSSVVVKPPAETGDPQDTNTSSDDSDVNPYYYLGEALKSDGYLPEDIEINEKIDGNSVYNGFKQKLQADLEPQIRQEIYQKLQDEGFTPTELLMARSLKNGVDPRLLQTGSMYETFATLPDDTDDSVKSGVITQMYKDRNFKDDEIKKLLTSAETDDNIDNLFVESKTYFAGKWNEFVEVENKKYTAAVQAKEANVRKVNDTIRNIITSGEILGDKLTKTQVKEFEDAVRKEKAIEFDGKKYRGTEMQEFLLNLENNPEMKFLLFKLYKFRDSDKNEIKTEVQKEVENSFLKGFESKLLSSKKAVKNTEIKNQLETKKATAEGFFLDFSTQKA